MTDSLRVTIHERLSQRVKYFPWWVQHPVEYRHSERLRRAANLLAQMLIDDDDAVEGIEVGMPNEQEGFALYARIEQYSP